MDPTLAFGTTFQWNSKTVAKLTNIGGIELSADMVDVTTHQSADSYKEKIAGLIDAGDVSIEGLLDPADADGQMAMLTDLNGRTKRAFVITFPVATGTAWGGNAYISKLKIGDAPIDGSLPFSATISITGKPTLTVAASAGLTTTFFAISESAVINPAPANTVYTYVATVLTGVTSVTVTPIATAGVITVNGNVVATGQASSSITLGEAGSVTPITIAVTETNKAPKTYTIYMSRA